MATPSRAPARTRKRPGPRPAVYSPELLEHGRQRYEHTTDHLVDIAAEFDMSETSLRRLAKREKWARYEPPPRTITPATQLLVEAAALDEATATPELPPADAVTASAQPPAVNSTDFTGAATPPQADIAAEAQRLLRGVSTELDIYEAMRARMRHLPETPAAAERTARTLSVLTATLYRVRHLCAGLNEMEVLRDDIPTDIDALREALALRIEAFMASQPDEDVAGGHDGAGAAPAPS